MHAARAPRHGLMMVSIMLATVVYTLDSTIAAVALPHMQGTFSATQEQIAWVLTSYMVSSAIMTPMAGYLASRFGRKRLFMITVTGFVLASVLCGISVKLEEMVSFRILQGAFGAPLIPLAQATILDAYTPATYGRGMALFGVGVMLGPIIGPTLGGWLTDTLSWHWVFLINVPIGIIALIGIQLSVQDAEDEPERTFDLAGFVFLAMAIGSLQLMLDRGNSLSWLQSTEVQIELLVALLASYLFIVQIFTSRTPFIEPAIFRDRNFSLSVLLSVAIGFNLMATMAILPPFMQSLLGYPVMATGWILAPRGVGTMISMAFVGRLVGLIDARILIITGLLCQAVAMWLMSLFDHNVTAWMLAGTGTLQGFGMGMMFVPMSSVAFATLAPRYRTEGTGIYSLARNIGSSMGISILMGALAVYVRDSREALVPFINPYNHALHNLQVPVVDPTSAAGLEMLNNLVQREALMLGYLNDFRLMMIMTLVTIPIVLILRPIRSPEAPTRA